VDQRERWQALQSNLSAARALVDAGDRAKALEAIDRALAIDPDFLAAHSLRDCILRPSAASEPVAPPPQIRDGSAPSATGALPSLEATGPGVSIDGYAKFEARAKRRRVDRRVDAARAALEHRRLKDAEIALEEIIELDPNLPELSELTMSFDELRRAAATTHRGPWFAAAASFAIVLFGASWLQQSGQLLPSIQTAGVATPVEVAPVLPTVPTETVEVAVPPATPAASIGTSGREAMSREITESRTGNPESRVANPQSRIPNPNPRLATSESRFIDAGRRAADREFPVTSPDPPAVNAASVESLQREPIALPPPPAPAPAIAAALVVPPAPPAVVAVSAPVTPRTIDPAEEVGLVRQTLQRYRTAYDGLDAQSARAVYPAVNQAALARAFDSLASQTLTFDACDVQLRGELATATCRGSARYVPKIGSHEPRIEPRTWNFTLRKAGTDWKIDSARAER